MKMLMLVCIFIWLIWPAQAQNIHHHDGESPSVDAFYSTWYMPDNPAKLCCNKVDCYPTEIKYQQGIIFAKRREDGAWIRVPPHKIERNRDNPDGRNHVCMLPPPPPNHPQFGNVLCFSLGIGG